MQSYITLLVITSSVIFTASSLAEQTNDDSKLRTATAKLEDDVIAAMQGGMGKSFGQLRKEIQRLSPAARRSLSVSIRPGLFEWRFRGQHPADDLSPQMMEYVVSAKDKSYETLLVVEGAELARARRFGEAFNTLRRRRPDVEIDVRLIWSHEGRPREVTLWEVFSASEVKKINKFIKDLQGNEFGLGADNLEADQDALPSERVDALVIVTLRLPKRAKR